MAGSNTINFADTIAQWITKSNNMDSDIGVRANLNTINKTDFVSAINEMAGAQSTLLDSNRGQVFVENELKLLDSARAITLVEGELKLLDSARAIALLPQGLDSSRYKAFQGESTTIDFDSSGDKAKYFVKDSALTSKNFKNSSMLAIENASGTVLLRMWSPDSPGG